MARLVVALLCAVLALAGSPLAEDAAAKAKPKRAKSCPKKPPTKKQLRKMSAKAKRKALACQKQRRRKAASQKAATKKTPSAPVVTTPEAAPDPSVSAPAQQPVTATDPTCDAESAHIGVRAEDAQGVFRLILSRTCINAGLLKVGYLNNDSSRHDVWIRDLDGGGARREVITETDGGQRASGQVTVTPGRWQLYCSLRGHETMKATVTAISP